MWTVHLRGANEPYHRQLLVVQISAGLSFVENFKVLVVPQLSGTNSVEKDILLKQRSGKMSLTRQDESVVQLAWFQRCAAELL